MMRGLGQYSNAKWIMRFFKILKIEDVNLFFGIIEAIASGRSVYTLNSR